MTRINTLRGCIIMKWKASGSSALVQYEKVLEWAKDCDSDLKSQNLNPAPVFRKHLEDEDEQYVKTFLKGCRFPFRIVNDNISIIEKQQVVHSPIVSTSSSAWRVCLKCGRLNLVDAVFCSYCGQAMPRDAE